MKNDKTHRFYAFRYFLVRNTQISLFENDKSPIVSMLEKCETEKQLDFEVNGKRDILIFVDKFDDKTYLFKFCRDFPITKYINDDNKKDIVEITESNYPYVYVIINIERQIILIEKKTTLYYNSTSVKNAFRLFIDYIIHNLNYTFSMDEIVDLSTFWEIVSSADSIYELRLNLKSPNLFGGALSTNELLKQIKETYNNDEVEMRFKNSKGKLQLNNEDIEDVIKYAGGGGGSWKLSISKKNRTKRETVDSKKGIKTVEINSLDSTINLERTNAVLDTIKDVDDILGDDE